MHIHEQKHKTDAKITKLEEYSEKLYIYQLFSRAPKKNKIKFINKKNIKENDFRKNVKKNKTWKNI